MLDYGYRSACCKAPIRLGTKKNSKTNIKFNIWICVKCGSRDVEIIPKSGMGIQPDPVPDSDL